MKRILLILYVALSLAFGFQESFALDYSKISTNTKIVQALNSLESINRKDVIAILYGRNATKKPIRVMFRDLSVYGFSDCEALTVKTKSQAKEQDLAIVIVMDISNTMLENEVEDGVSRLDAAMSAGEQLINDFATYSTGVSAVRKIGYVAFNTHANQIFALSDCKSATIATNLINTMNTSTQSIISNTTDGEPYKESIDRFTNIEGGLKRAHDMLYTGEGASIQNKYIIIFDDSTLKNYLFLQHPKKKFFIFLVLDLFPDFCFSSIS